jgi:hypothetical protein
VKPLLKLSVLSIALCQAGCGTRLTMRSVAIPEPKTASCGEIPEKDSRQACEAFNRPEGIVVNQRARYRVDVAASGSIGIEDSLQPVRLIGVDHDRLLVVDYRRQPFASGELSLSLDASQTIETIAIESEAGETAAIQSLGSVIDADRDVKAAKKKQARD